jgi:hypothetical protein
VAPGSSIRLQSGSYTREKTITQVERGDFHNRTEINQYDPTGTPTGDWSVVDYGGPYDIDDQTKTATKGSYDPYGATYQTQRSRKYNDQLCLVTHEASSNGQPYNNFDEFDRENKHFTTDHGQTKGHEYRHDYKVYLDGSVEELVNIDRDLFSENPPRRRSQTRQARRVR